MRDGPIPIARISSRRVRPAETRVAMEEKRPRWGVRTSNPGGAVSRSWVGSTPILLRQFPRPPRKAPPCAGMELRDERRPERRPPPAHRLRPVAGGGVRLGNSGRLHGADAGAQDPQEGREAAGFGLR